MKNAAFVVWLVLRITRWISGASFLAYSFATTLDCPNYLNCFDQPLHSTEAWLFGLAGDRLGCGPFRTDDARAGRDRET
jgi:hypothetical protein